MVRLKYCAELLSDLPLAFLSQRRAEAFLLFSHHTSTCGITGAFSRPRIECLPRCLTGRHELSKG